MGLSFRRMPTWLIRRRRRERRRQWDLRAALPRGSVWYSRAHREPLFSTSHSSSGDTGPLSTRRHRGQPDLLFLSRVSRKYGCSSRGCAPIYSRATTVGSLDISHATVRCHRSRANSPASRVRSSKWLISNQDKCTIPLSRPSLREHQ